MKKASLLLLILVLLTNCTPPRETERMVFHYGFDFTKYSKDGFLFTPENYKGDYESIALITTVVYPAVKRKEVKEGQNSNVLYAWTIEPMEADNALNEMYLKAKKLGADAVILFKSSDKYYMNGSLYVPGFEVSGFAIKRK